MPKPPPHSDPAAEEYAASNPANLAAAAYDLWQAQWQLLHNDPEMLQDFQTMLEQFGQMMASTLTQQTPANRQSTMKGGADYATPAAASTSTVADATAQNHGPQSFAAASGNRQPDVAELAALVATLAAKVTALETRLESIAASKGRKNSPSKRKIPT
jgi:hypothetical protein